MSFAESLKEIRQTVRDHGGNLVNEEVTKQACLVSATAQGSQALEATTRPTGRL